MAEGNVMCPRISLSLFVLLFLASGCFEEVDESSEDAVDSGRILNDAGADSSANPDAGTASGSFCYAGGTYYADGETGIPAGDSCNTCECSDGSLYCTHNEECGTDCLEGGGGCSPGFPQNLTVQVWPLEDSFVSGHYSFRLRGDDTYQQDCYLYVHDYSQPCEPPEQCSTDTDCIAYFYSAERQCFYFQVELRYSISEIVVSVEYGDEIVESTCYPEYEVSEPWGPGCGFCWNATCDVYLTW